MLWRAAGIAAGPSALDLLLSRDPAPSLEELLAEDEVVQECKALNGRLVERLREGPAVRGLLRHALGLGMEKGTAEATAGEAAAEEKEDTGAGAEVGGGDNEEEMGGGVEGEGGS